MSLFVPLRVPAPRTAVASAPSAIPSGMKAGPVGPGAGVLMTEFPLLTTLLGQNPQAKMRRAYQLAVSVPWVRTAERVISGKGSTVDWHLEDRDDVEIDDEYADTQAQRARSFIEKPQAAVPIGRKLTRREMWALTLRHMGVCGTAFWYLDQRDAYAGTPDAALYIRPDRMTPKEDSNGNLLFWSLDERPDHPGTRLDLNEVAQFNLEPPDSGHFGTGLVESALLKAQNSSAFDQHVAQVLSAGGRLSGLLAPKANDILNNDQYMQLVADLRTVVEQPDAAKRMQVLRGPVDFTATTMTIADLQLRDMMVMNRDDLLSLWGVPLTQAAGQGPTGLNSGDSRKYDRQTLWENAIHPRLVVFVEVVQFEILDRWQLLDTTVELEIDEPSFEDDGARFDLLLKSLNLPLRNWERRELVGREPFGPDVINPSTGMAFDDEVWVPDTQVLAFVAPEDETGIDGTMLQVEDEALPDEAEFQSQPRALMQAGETPQGKAGPPMVFGRPNPNYVPKGSSKKRKGKGIRARSAKRSSGSALKYASGRGGRYRQIGNARAAATFRGAYSTAAGAAPPASPPVGRVAGKASLQPSQVALLASSQRLRREMDARITPRLQQATSSVLDAQRREIGMRVKAAAAHLMQRSGDTTVWWDGIAWDRRMREALAPQLTSMAEELDVHLRTAVRGAGKATVAGPVAAVKQALDHAGTRITAINDRTRAAVLGVVRETVALAIANGESVTQAGEHLQEAISAAKLDNGGALFDDYRAEMIARTELMGAYNAAALGTYSDLGALQVQAIDGDFDEACAARNGEIFTTDEANMIEDHPNGTLDWVPVIGAFGEGAA